MNYIPVSLRIKLTPQAGTSQEVTNNAGTSQTPNANASEEKDEDAELIVVPSAVKNTEEKKDNPKILAFRRELEAIAQKHLGIVPENNSILVTPKTSHLNVVKRIFKYLKGKPNLGLWYPRESPFDLEAFSDSDYGGSNLDRKSTTAAANFASGQVLWVQNHYLGTSIKPLKQQSTDHHTPNNPRQEATTSQLMTRIGDLEKQLKETKQTFRKAILTLVDRVKTLEVALKRKTKRVHLYEFPKEEKQEAREEQVEDISPTTLEAAAILTKVHKIKSVDKGKRYKRRKSSKEFAGTGLDFEEVKSAFEKVNTGGIKVSSGIEELMSRHFDAILGIDPVTTDSIRVSVPSLDRGRREGKAPMTEEEETQASRKTKEQILQEEAGLAEAIQIRSFRKSFWKRKKTRSFPSCPLKPQPSSNMLKETKQTFGKAILTLVDIVKTLEVALKRKTKRVLLSDSEEEETEAQGRKTHDLDPLEQVEDISPTTLKAAAILTKVQKIKSVDKGKRYKRRKSSKEFTGTGLDFEEVKFAFEKVNIGGIRVSVPSPDRSRREGKAPMIEEEETQASRKTKEQILQEEARLAEAIRLDALEKEEVAKQVHLDSLIAQRMVEEQKLIDEQKKRKAQESMLGKDLTIEDYAKRMVELLKKLNFEEVKAEFENLVKQLDTYVPMNFEATKESLKRFGEELQTKTAKKLKFDDEGTQPTEEKIEEDKDDKPTKKTRKRRKQIARKGFHTDHDKDGKFDILDYYRLTSIF
ncbi:hypothetical protein Tco_0025057 [Tanacetum coccineum]